MQLRHFVSGSAVVLAGWLALTFFYEMPSQRYPKLDKYPKSAASPGKTAPAVPVIIPVSAVVEISGSH